MTGNSRIVLIARIISVLSFLDFLYRDAEYLPRRWVLEERDQPHSVRSVGRLGRKGHILGEGALEIDRAYLFHDPHYADVRKISAIVLTTPDVGLDLVVRDGQV